MADVRCKYAGSDRPRVLVGRHSDECDGSDHDPCGGCLDCPMDHCRVCGIEHASGGCPECVGEVRDLIAEIRERVDALPEEVEVRGVNGEAMTLLGPVANAEARQHWEASVLAGRIVPMECDARNLEDVVRWLETADDERHPLLVIGTWSMVYRDAFEHDEPTGRVDLANELGYIDRNLTYMATFEHVPFEDFVRDLRGCVSHLEQVLGDSSRGERTNIDCLDCGGALERRLGKDGFEDVATCRLCHRRYTDPEYNFAVKRTYIRNALWLSDNDMTIRTGVKAETVRSWARAPKDDTPPQVRKESQLGRTVYLVADVERIRDTKGLAPCA